MQSESCTDDNKANQRNSQDFSEICQLTANGAGGSLNNSLPKSLSLQEGLSKSASKDNSSLSHEKLLSKSSQSPTKSPSSLSMENLLSKSGPTFLYASSTSEKEAERNWNLSLACQCTSKPILPRNLFSNIRSYSRFNSYRSGGNVWASSHGKRIEFDMMDEGQGGGSPPGLGEAPMRMRASGGGLNETSSSSVEHSIAETNYHLSNLSSSSDSSDTDDEYYTPPGSYVEEYVHASSSSEEEMLDAMEEDVEIFLIGNSLSATDIDVIQTLAQCESILDPAKYPNIYKWRHLTLLKLNQDTLPRPSDTIASPRNVNRFYSPSARFITSPPASRGFITSPPASRALGKYVTPSPKQLFPPPSVSLSTGGPCSPLSRPAPSSYKPLQHSTPSNFIVEKS
uniref:Uncharacterized protein n=1 Tax=Cacopsylla melanoneura TaxID=428564 RepID=A0A8D8SJU0_9HEMI